MAFLPPLIGSPALPNLQPPIFRLRSEYGAPRRELASSWRKLKACETVSIIHNNNDYAVDPASGSTSCGGALAQGSPWGVGRWSKIDQFLPGHCLGSKESLRGKGGGVHGAGLLSLA